MKDMLNFLLAIKWHVAVIVVIWMILKAWRDVVRMRLEHDDEMEEPLDDPTDAPSGNTTVRNRGRFVNRAPPVDGPLPAHRDRPGRRGLSNRDD